MKKLLIAIFSFVTIIYITESCQKIDATPIGGNLFDNVNTFDTTLDVITDLRLLTDSTSVPYANFQSIYYFSTALGVMDDPEFGRTSANSYFEVLPPSPGSRPFSPKDSILRIDSVILSLNYKGLYGDSMSVENFTVYEIAQSANFIDSLYPLTSPDFPVSGALSPTVTVNFNTLNDPKRVRPGKDTAVTVQNVLRIPLNVSLGERLANYDTSVYKTDSSFRTFFKGLAIKVDTNTSPVKRALAYFDLTAASTRIYVYYRATVNAITDTLVTEFSLASNRSSARAATIVRRSITGSNYANNLGNPEKAQDRLYIQSAPGSYASIYVPGLKSLSNRLIHKAELIAPALPSQEGNLFTPPVLFLDLIDSAKPGIKTVRNDFIADLANGSYNQSSFGGGIKQDAYRFDLSRYIQAILTKKDSVYSFRLYAPFYTLTPYARPNGQPAAVSAPVTPFIVNAQVAAGRVILAGGNHPTNRMRVRIIYSKI